MGSPEVRVRSWVRASDDEVRSGMLGFLSVEYGTLILDSIVLRRTADGRFALSFPARTDRAGRRHSYVRPADDNARRQIEREILGQLGQNQELGVREEADDA
jgi:hypothetical protein